MTSMSETTGYPVVRAAVNQHLRQIMRQSEYRISVDGVADVSSAIIDDPVAFEYAGTDGSSFRLAPAGFVALGQSGGYVYDITVALPERAKPIDEAYRVAAGIDHALSGTRWRREGGALPTLDQFRSPAEGSGGSPGGEVGRWRLGTAELTAMLKRTAERGERSDLPGRRLPEDLYVVEVNIFDGALRRAFIKRTFDIRRARQGGNTTEALLLSSILEDSTPVPQAGSAEPPRP